MHNWSTAPWVQWAQLRPLRPWRQIASEDPTISFFWTLLGAHVLLWTVLSAWTQPNLPDETLQLLTAGRTFSLGYPGQPPLAVWLVSMVGALAAPWSWPIYLFGQLCVATTIWSAWMLGRRLFHPWTALCAALVLVGGYACTLSPAQVSGAVLGSAFWSLAILSFHAALTSPRRRYWVATGACLAFGFLSAYGTFLLFVAMVIFTIWDQRARLCWDSSWPFLAALSMGAILLPHLIWLMGHDFLTIQLGLNSAKSVTDHLSHPMAFLGEQLLTMAPLLFLVAPLVAWFSLEERTSPIEDDHEFAKRFLLWMTCLPPAMIFTLSMAAGPSSGIFVGISLWTFLGLMVLVWGHLQEERLSWRRVLIRTGCAAGVCGALLIVMNIMLPHLSQRSTAVHFPGPDVAAAAQRAWNTAGYSGTPPIVGGDEQLVRNASWYAASPLKPAIYDELDPARSPGVTDQELLRSGGVLLWKLDEDGANVNSEYQHRFGAVSWGAPVTVAYRTTAKAPPLRFGVAVVPPAGAAPPSSTTTYIPEITPQQAALQLDSLNPPASPQYTGSQPVQNFYPPSPYADSQSSVTPIPVQQSSVQQSSLQQSSLQQPTVAPGAAPSSGLSDSTRTDSQFTLPQIRLNSTKSTIPISTSPSTAPAAAPVSPTATPTSETLSWPAWSTTP